MAALLGALVLRQAAPAVAAPGAAELQPREAVVGGELSGRRAQGLEKFLDRLADDGPSLATVIGVGGACYGKLRQLEGKQEGFEKSLEARLDASEKALRARLDSSERALGARLDSSERALGARLDSSERALETRLHGVEQSLAGLTGRFDQLLVSFSVQQGFTQAREAERQTPQSPDGGGRRRRQGRAAPRAARR